MNKSRMFEKRKLHNYRKANISPRCVWIVKTLQRVILYYFLIVIIISFALLFIPNPPSIDDRQTGTFMEQCEHFRNETYYEEKVCYHRKGFMRKYLNVTKPAIVIWKSRIIVANVFVYKLGKIECDIIRVGDGKILPPGIRGAYLFHGPFINLRDLPLPRYPDQNIWMILREESPKYSLELSHEKALNLFNYSATFSRHSDIPFPLQYIKSLGHITDERHFVETSLKNQALKEISAILYIQSSCLTLTNRDAYVRDLMKYQRIDSYGSCLKNKHSSNYSKRPGYDHLSKLWDDGFLKFIGRYKFMITIENGVCDDYISEKIWRALHAGVVPIYFGAPNIRDWLPNEKSAILIEDFPTPKLLSNHINKLMEDDNLYEEYLEHKLMGKISNKNLFKEIEERPYQTNAHQVNEMFIQFACKKLHAKDEGVHIVTKSHYNCGKHAKISAKRQKKISLGATAEINTVKGSWQNNNNENDSKT